MHNHTIIHKQHKETYRHSPILSILYTYTQKHTNAITYTKTATHTKIQSHKKTQTHKHTQKIHKETHKSTHILKKILIISHTYTHKHKDILTQ